MDDVELYMKSLIQSAKDPICDPLQHVRPVQVAFQPRRAAFLSDPSLTTPYDVDPIGFQVSHLSAEWCPDPEVAAREGGKAAREAGLGGRGKSRRRSRSKSPAGAIEFRRQQVVST